VETGSREENAANQERFRAKWKPVRVKKTRQINSVFERSGNRTSPDTWMRRGQNKNPADGSAGFLKPVCPDEGDEAQGQTQTRLIRQA
jgi:hypothetical protein